MSNGFSMDNPLNELGHISLHAQQLSQATANLAATTKFKPVTIVVAG